MPREARTFPVTCRRKSIGIFRLSGKSDRTFSTACDAPWFQMKPGGVPDCSAILFYDFEPVTVVDKLPRAVPVDARLFGQERR